MTIGTLLLVILIVALVGGAAPWSGNPNGPYPERNHFYGTGIIGGGSLGLVVVILIVLILAGRL